MLRFHESPRASGSWEGALQVSDFHPSMTLYIRTADNTISSFLSGSVLKIVS